jgi:hypothetical protein
VVKVLSHGTSTSTRTALSSLKDPGIHVTIAPGRLCAMASTPRELTPNDGKGTTVLAFDDLLIRPFLPHQSPRRT